MLLGHTDFIKLFIGLFAVTNPLGAIPIFIALTVHTNDFERKSTAKTTAFGVFLILFTSLILGQIILKLFGISISSFRVGGGFLIFLMAISMLHAKGSSVKHTPKERDEAEGMDSIAIVPLAMPLIAGPGGISSVILAANKAVNWQDYASITLAIILLSLLIWVILRLAPIIAKHISRTGLNIITRIMGLILAAIAVEFIAAGLKGLFPILQHLGQ